MERVILTASSGMVLTNGVVYGKQIYLNEGASAADFYEITEGAYHEMFKDLEV